LQASASLHGGSSRNEHVSEAPLQFLVQNVHVRCRGNTGLQHSSLRHRFTTIVHGCKSIQNSRWDIGEPPCIRSRPAAISLPTGQEPVDKATALSSRQWTESELSQGQALYSPRRLGPGIESDHLPVWSSTSILPYFFRA
jgi:hypothetical protein